MTIFSAKIIVHEASHMWFGNLVTNDWWEDIWLNEGFAKYWEYHVLDLIKPHWKVWERYIFDIFEKGFQQDKLL